LKIAKLVTMQFSDLDRVFQTFQDRIKQILDLVCDNPFSKVNVVSVTFPDSKHSTTHADGTVGYDSLVPHGMGVASPRFFATTLQATTLPPGFTAPDMTKALVNQSPDNTAKNQTPLKTILLTCSQPSILAQVVFF
jgi:hypothetical protein